ncbi:MAG: hypothetical protein MAG431_01825 [Chloroflexi bacterium]|nr:hypothetical protein [Chloroflexota bacterium]
MRFPSSLIWIILLTITVSACATTNSTSTPLPPADPATEEVSPPEDTTAPTEAAAPDDAPAPAEATPTLLPAEAPPPGAESQFSTDFSKHSVPYDEILSGGPPKDGIPALDDPQFITVEEANEWLESQEPIILVKIGDDAQAYPLQILMWHEIANATVGDVPVTVTFCPLCNTGISFERTFDGQVLDFGTTGRLRNSNLIMYDRQTETWWQQATGEAMAGEYTGRRLTPVPSFMISWEDFKTAYPGGKVLSKETGYNRSYGRNPYGGYDNINSSPFLFSGELPEGDLPPMARVLTVEIDDEAVGYPYQVLEEVHVVNDTVGGTDLVVIWDAGTASALDAGSVAGGRDVGAAVTFSREVDGQTLTFTFDGENILDEQTESVWNVLGQAVSGPLAGSQLTPITSINHFWFSWAAFRPETRIYEGE